MGPNRTVEGWLACPVVDSTKVETVRDRLYNWLGEPETYRREHEPHVSLFGVRLPEDRAETFERDFEEFADRVGGWNGVVEGYLLYPSVRNPMVVTLDVSFPFESVASPIADLLAQHGGRISRKPTIPHLTLLKGGVRGEELQWAQVDEETRRRLSTVCGRREAADTPDSIVEPRFSVSIGRPELEWD